MDSVRVLCTVVATCDLAWKQFDVVTAFLNADVKEETYMKQPQGFRDGIGRVCRLLKALYGLPASPLWWFELVTKLCIFRKKYGALLILYVDDMIIAATTTEEIDQIGADLTDATGF
jgi:hypothetical protein